MMLIEQTTVPALVLPVQAFRDHLRLGSGFADDAIQDTVLEQVLRAAMAAIEVRTGKVLVSRDFIWTLAGWRDPAEQALPVAPVTAITGLTMIDRLGTEVVIDPARYALRRDEQRPRVEATAACLPAIPLGGSARIAFRAGFSADWANLPADLSHAVFLLAAHYYEHRSESAPGDGGMIPYGVGALIARYRTVRILGGGAR